MFMRERRFSKVTKWEIALGAVASLMTGVVVGLVYREKRKKKKCSALSAAPQATNATRERKWNLLWNCGGKACI